MDGSDASGSTDTGDRELVRRAREGDRAAFRSLVQRHQDALYRYAMRMTGQGDLAADVVQAAFVKAYTRLDRCRRPERFRAWVFRMVANACRDEFRREKRRRYVRLDDEASPGFELTSDEDPARDLERAELRERLERAIASLPGGQREAFLLKHVELRSYEEMSEILDASVSALKMRVHRAREALQAHLEEVPR